MSWPSLFTPTVRADLLARIDTLTEAHKPTFGKLTPQRMLCHLTDALRIAVGEQAPGSGKYPALYNSGVGRWLAIDSPLPWPKGRIVASEGFFATASDPGAFERDRVRLRLLIDRFSGPQISTMWGVSPAFGALTPDQWARLCARHIDHHLRQFGI